MDTAGSAAPLTTRSLSIVILCYKDAGSIREFHRRLDAVLPRLTPNYEIVYVNNGSPDNAEEILREIAAIDPHWVVVNLTRNFPPQNGLLAGMHAARGDAVVLMDGDLQDPPEVVPQLVEKWLQGFDIVYGVRVKRKETLFRQVAYKAFYRVFRRMANFEIPVDAGDFSLMTRRVVETLLTEFPERVVYLRGLRAFTAFKSTGVDYVRQPRFDGRSSNSLVSNLRWARLAIVSFSDRPLEYIAFLAFWTVLLAVFGAFGYLIAYFVVGRTTPSGFMTLLLVTMILGGVQLVCFSIIAEYVRQIYEEVKRRPRYFVREVIDHRALLDETQWTEPATSQAVSAEREDGTG